ncbi:uncharacterized protein LOC106468888 [Limulus polyphemus]|uniref:Uncharacterized protein LOC106468888 n=1 Tax=Limulus polyphemus TaxID=6850 RepID=A0ABM1TAQ7_LIMPO|nr:uncharacterized protein LOC106468888 [Limulus polyphemus]
MEESCLTGTVNTTVKRRVKRRPSVIHQARKVVNSQEKSLHKSMLSRSRLGSCTNHKRKIQALLANNKALAQALEVSKCELRQRDEVILELCRQNSLTVPTLIKGKLQEVCNHLHSMVKILQEALTLCDRPEDSTVLLTCSDETNKSLKVDQSQSVTSTITPVHVQAKNKKSFLGQNKSTKFEKPAENLLKKHKSDTSQDTPCLLKVSQFKSNNQAPASEMTPIIEQSFLVEEEALPFLIEDKDTTSVLISDDIISHVHINNKRRYSSRIEGKQKSLEFVEEIHTGSGDGDSLDLLSEGGLAEETLESCRQFHPSVLLERLSHDPITGSNLGDILPNTIKSKRAIEEQEFNNNIDLSVTPKLPKLHSKIPVVKSSKTESDKKLNSAQNRRDTFTVPILQQSKRKEIFPVNSFEENSRRGTFVVQRLKEDSKSKTDTKSIEKVSLSPSQQESDTILISRTFSVVEPNQDILKPELQGNQSDNSKEIETCLSGCSVGVVDVGTCGPKEPSVKSSSEDKRLLLSPLVSQRHNDKSKPVHHPCSQEEDATCVLPEDMELTCTLDTLVASQSRSLITTDPVDGTHHPQGSSVEQNHRSQAKLAEKVELSGEKSITSVATLDHEQTFSEDNDDDPEYVPSPNKHNRRKNKQKTGGNLHGKNRKEKIFLIFDSFPIRVATYLVILRPRKLIIRQVENLLSQPKPISCISQCTICL